MRVFQSTLISTYIAVLARSRRNAMLLGFLLLVSGCGWQLKGSFDNTDKLGSVYVGGDAVNGVINKTVRTDIRTTGGEVSELRANADYIVWIGEERTRIRPASYDALVRTVENEIIIHATFEVRSAAGELIHGPERVFAERVYEYDVQGVTSSAAQLTIIERELRERLGHQIVRRLAAIDPNAKEDTKSVGGPTQAHQH